MRRFRMFVALLLVFSFFLPCCGARGEKCYQFLRELLSYKPDSEWYLGQGISDAAEAGPNTYAMYMEKNKAFTLYGFNAEGQGELTVWADVDMVKGYSMVYMLCYCWDRIQPFVEEGHPFSIAVSRVDGDSLVIRDAETAAAIVSELEEAGFAAPPTEE